MRIEHRIYFTLLICASLFVRSAFAVDEPEGAKPKPTALERQFEREGRPYRPKFIDPNFKPPPLRKRKMEVSPLCVTSLVEVPTHQQVLVSRTQYLPFLTTQVDLVKIIDTPESLQYVVRAKSGDTMSFQVSILMDYWLNEVLYRRELNHALKIDSIHFRSIMPRVPRRIPRITVNRNYITPAQAEGVLKTFISEVQSLELVWWDWRRSLSEETLLTFLRSLPHTDSYRREELINRFYDRFRLYYGRLSTPERLVLTRNFFDPQRPLTTSEKLIHQFLFQGNEAARRDLLQGIKTEMTKWFDQNPPHLLRDTDYNPSVSRSLYYTQTVDLGLGAKVGDTHVLSARANEIEPLNKIEDLLVSEDLKEVLQNAGYLTADQFIFKDAEAIVRELHLSKEEFIELADAMFNEGIPLFIDATWDRSLWNVSRDRTYLRLPKRIVPKQLKDLTPVNNCRYDEG